MNSILASTKKMLGIEKDYTPFDLSIIADINSVFMNLNQLGVGPKEGFSISGYDEEWTDFSSRTDITAIQSYMYLKVKLLFDPPSSSFVLESSNKQISEFEWRMRVEAEGGPDFATEERDPSLWGEGNEVGSS